MSFNQDNTTSKIYAPGHFLAHEECVRETRQILQAGATTKADGSKYVKMGTLISVTTGTGQDAVTDYIGFVYEDVDVTTGNMPGSVVTKGVVYEDRLPAELAAAAKTALEAKGFTFVTEPTVTRPNWTNA
jgi:hypothetical protein